MRSVPVKNGWIGLKSFDFYMNLNLVLQLIRVYCTRPVLRRSGSHGVEPVLRSVGEGLITIQEYVYSPPG